MLKFPNRLKLRSRILSVLLIVTVLTVSFSGVAFALPSGSLWGENTTLSSDMFDSAQWRSLYAYMEPYLDDYSYAVVGYNPNYNNRYSCYAVLLCSDPVVGIPDFGLGTVLFDYPDVTGMYFWSSTQYQDGTPYNNNLGYSGSYQGHYMYTMNYQGTVNLPMFRYGTLWSTSDIDSNFTNLFYRDSRYFTVTTSTYNDSPYLVVTADVDIENITSMLTVYYTDSLGSYSYTYADYQYVGKLFDNPYSEFKVNVLTLPTDGDFVITGAKLTTSSLTWGEKEISLNYHFDGQNMPTPTYDITYFNNYPPSDGDSPISVSYNDSLEYLSLSGVYYLRDGQANFVVPFDCNFIAIYWEYWNDYGPSLAVPDNYLYMLFEEYDVIIVGVESQMFDYIYGSGASSGIDPSWNSWIRYYDYMCRLTPTCKSIGTVAESYYAEMTSVFTQSECGIIFTRSYLLKKIWASMGDVDSRLLDLEYKLMNQESGVLTNIQLLLASNLDQNHTFFDKALDFFNSVNAHFNELRFLNFYENVLVYLRDIRDFLTGGIFETLPPYVTGLGDIVEPFKSIFLFFKGVADETVSYLPDFQDYTRRMIDVNYPLFPTPIPTPIPIPYITPDVEVPTSGPTLPPATP